MNIEQRQRRKRNVYVKAIQRLRRVVRYAFEAAQQQRETAEAEGQKKEQESAAATLALYQYAAVHAKDIKLKNGELAFSTESMRLEFSGQFENSKALFNKWQADLQERAGRQQQARAAISPSIK